MTKDPPANVAIGGWLLLVQANLRIVHYNRVLFYKDINYDFSFSYQSLVSYLYILIFRKLKNNNSVFRPKSGNETNSIFVGEVWERYIITRTRVRGHMLPNPHPQPPPYKRDSTGSRLSGIWVT